MYRPLTGQDSREVSSAGHSGRHAKPSPGGLALAPPVDIFEDENGFTLIADIFGDVKEELVVRVTGDNLLIESATTIPATGSMELACGEIQSPQYRRGFTLSRELHPGRIETKLAGGMLNLLIPKSEEARPRRAASMSASADACPAHQSGMHPHAAIVLQQPGLACRLTGSFCRLVNFRAPPDKPMNARHSGLVNIVIHSLAHRKRGQARAGWWLPVDSSTA